MSVFSPVFFERPVLLVARDLLGAQLIRIQNGVRLSGTIIEAEAYDGEQDLACHARSGHTPRNEVMYGPAGHAYIYFTYGMHWMMNVVTGETGYPAAVLLRGLLPTEGLDIIASQRKGQSDKLWCNGPAKLTRAFSIDGLFNRADLCDPFGDLRLEIGAKIPEDNVEKTPRIGIQNTPEPWRSLPWRFLVKQSGIQRK